MTTLVLDQTTQQLPLGPVFDQVGEGIAVKNSEGKLLALVISPDDPEGLLYAAAFLDLYRNADKMREAMSRKSGITTAELLKKCEMAAKEAEQ